MGSRRTSPALLAAACALAVSLAAPAPAPAASDPLRADQWGLRAIGAPEAWQRSSGAGVVVAVVDSGVDIGHPDLAGNIWTNPGEIADNGVDDDQNGIVDDVHGANLLDGTGDVADEHGHGTHIAGIIAARAGNGVGGAGVAPRAQIMPVKVHSEAAGSRMSALAAGIRYAAEHGARVINVSMIAPQSSPDLEEAVAVAAAHGATVVAAAGNDGVDLDAEPVYPIALGSDAVLGVTASTPGGGPDREVSFGRRTVDLAAPGTTILSTVPGRTYELRAGTSMAAPFVSGALALLAAARPDLSQAELRAALLRTARGGAGYGARVGAGALDVGAAMHSLVPGDWGAQAPAAGVASRGSDVRVGRLRIVRGARRATVRWRLAGASVTRWRVVLDGRVVATAPGSRRAARLPALRSGRHRIAVVALGAAGRPVWRATRVLAVRR